MLISSNNRSISIIPWILLMNWSKSRLLVTCVLLLYSIVIILFFLLFYCWFPLFWSFCNEDKKTKNNNIQISLNINSISTISWILWHSTGPRPDDAILCILDEYIYTQHKLSVMPNFFLIYSKSLYVTPVKPQAFEILINLDQNPAFFPKKPGA